MIKTIKVIGLFLFLYFYLVVDSLAVDYYTESFNEPDVSKWDYYCNYSFTNPKFRALCNEEEINYFYNDGVITLDSTSENFPVVISKPIAFPQSTDFSVRINFRYPTVTHRGVGLGIGFTGPYGRLFSQFGIWNDTSSRENFKFYYNDFNEISCSDFNSSTNNTDTQGRQTISNIQLKDSSWHYLIINRIGDNYYVYLDRLVDENIPVFSTNIRNNCVPKIIWFGNFISDSGGAWTSFSLNDLVVTSDLLTPTLTPIPTIIPTETPIPTPTETPTPIPTEVPVPKEKKIFILPGLGASWNSEAIVFGNNVNDNQWKMTPFVNNYDGLIELLNNNGLVKDEDYFVWNYDWRRTLEDIETNFDEYVEGKNLDEDDEIYLVGHSLGGLIARLWASGNINDYEIKEVITLGSPHLGSLDSYSVWNGAEILTNKGISSIAFKILLGLQNKSFLIKDLDKVRSFAPITKDLLPVFDYALKSGKLLSWQNLESKNDNLYNKNQSINDLGTRLTLFVGTGYTTPSVLKLGKRTVFDKALGLWPDGQILSFNTSDGDGTVLKTSAQNNSSVSTVLNSDHGGIVYNSLNYISEKLDLINRNISVEYVDNFSDSLLVFIGSPATGKLICNGQVFEENEGFILASNQDFNNCNLELSPTDNGKVHLVFGNTKNSDWEYLEKDVVINEIERLEISASLGKIVVSKNNKNFLLSMIKNDLKTLGLNKAIQSLDKNDYIKVLAYVFKYRETHDEKIISQRILDNLLIISTINNNDKKRFDYKLVEKYIKLIEAVISLKYRVKPLPSDNAVAFEVLKNFGQEVKVLVKNRTYPNFWIANTLLAGYSKEVLNF